MVALLPCSNPIPSISATLLLPSSTQIQVVDPGDGGSSESESTELDEAIKKTSEVNKVSKAPKLISPAPKNPFSSASKALTPVKSSVDTLGIASNIIGTKSWLENTLDRKKKRKEEGAPNKETVSSHPF